MLAGFVLSLLTYMALKRRDLTNRPHAFLTLIGAVFLLQMFLTTGSLSRYFIFPIVFVAVGMSGRTRWLALSAVLGVTITAAVGQYGSMALVLQDFPAHAPQLAPQANVISRLAADLYLSDWFMTMAALLNGVCIVVLLVALTKEVARGTASQVEDIRERIIAGDAPTRPVTLRS